MHCEVVESASRHNKARAGVRFMSEVYGSAKTGVNRFCTYLDCTTSGFIGASDPGFAPKAKQSANNEMH